MGASTLTYQVPRGEKKLLHSLPIGMQAEILFLLGAFKSIDVAKPKAPELARLAAEAGAKNYRGSTVKSLDRKRGEYRNGTKHHDAGDWTMLVDRARVPDWHVKQRKRLHEGNVRLPAEFVEYWKGLHNENKRSGRQAHDKLVRLWRQGEKIPGYGHWWTWHRSEFPQMPKRQTCPPDLPPGWSYENLMRPQYKPDTTETSLARRGIAAARETLPTIIGTRVGMRPFEHIVLDDWRADFQVHVDCKEVADLNGILAMDVASATALRFGVRPATRRDDGVATGLKRIDTKSVLAGLLFTYGYPTEYVMNVWLENGTATITPDDAAAIYEATNGQVIVHYTSMISGRVFGFKDQPVGNFKGKAWLESFFNLLHNICADIKGQQGAHYQLRARELPMRIRAFTDLAKKQAELPEQLKHSLQYRVPFVDVAGGRDGIQAALRLLNHRTRHDLEGFERVLKWRRKGTHDDWQPMCLLEGATPDFLDKIETHTFLESPWDRLNRLCDGVKFEKVHADAMPMLLAKHKQVTIEKPGQVNVGSRSKPVTYTDIDDPRLKPGAKFLAYIDTQDDEWIHLTTPDTGYVVSLRKDTPVQRGDTERLSREIEARTGYIKRKIETARGYDREASELAEDAQHNKLIAEQAGAINLVELPVNAETAPVPVFAEQIHAAGSAVADHRREVEEKTRAAADYSELAQSVIAGRNRKP